jgi:hypothetical protein
MAISSDILNDFNYNIGKLGYFTEPCWYDQQQVVKALAVVPGKITYLGVNSTSVKFTNKEQARAAIVALEALVKQFEAEALPPIAPGTRVSYVDTSTGERFGVVAAVGTYEDLNPSVPARVWAFWGKDSYPGYMPRNRVTVAPVASRW